MGTGSSSRATAVPRTSIDLDPAGGVPVSGNLTNQCRSGWRRRKCTAAKPARHCRRAKEAIVVDPMRDVDGYVAAANAEGLRLVAAAETHIHADFLSGARELAERAGVTVYASAEGGPEWQLQWLRDSGYAHRLLRHGDVFHVGRVAFAVLHTPGHTPEHLCFLVTDAGASRPMGVLTGDFVCVGDVGRPDLLESAAGERGTTEPSARALYASIQRFHELPPELQIWPGHGAGSACARDLGAVPVSTVGYEIAVNPSLAAATSEEAFVSYILDGQPEPPLYFARMKGQNREGPRVLGSLPRPRRVRDGKLTELSGATGVAVLDTRPWEAYRDAHLPGALFVPLDRDFNTVAGCYVPDGMAIYLIIDERRLQETIVDLIHVGLDNIVGYATPEMFVEYAGRGGKIARVQEVEADSLDDLAAKGAFLLDVRAAAEVGERGAVPGAHRIAHTRLLAQLDEVPRDRPVVALCQTGSRSTVAAGLLDRFGHRAVHLAGGVSAWTARAEGAAEAGG